MQATKSAKAKLRLHDTSSPGQQGSDKTIRRYSLPSSSNNARVTSDFPETTRGSNLGGKTGKRPKKLNGFRSKHGVENMGHGYSSSWSSWCMLGYILSTFEALDIFRMCELDSLDTKESELPSQSL
ncbi:hypothetical protein Bca4012_032266 [Brassica carinata]|uniref:(rape) hypothetical protein n=1 Tax=Brassica napus TaxID=3708 RepID=A0A816JRW1_BRANA|nr:unnamed protein product [Brassica napus]